MACTRGSAGLYIRRESFITRPSITDCSLSFNRHSIFATFRLPVYLPVYSDTTKKKDKDGDNIPDSLDKCPDDKGILLYDGCPVPDSDNDGISDDVDACPTIAGIIKFKGCPSVDSDGDKIDDEVDKCPNIPGVARFDGCLVSDRDGDGLNDDLDKCIDLAGPINNQGCPEARKKSPFRKEKKSKKL